MASYVKAICDRNPIHTTAQKTPGDNGFKISFEGTPSEDKFRPGEVYTGKSITNANVQTPKLINFELERERERERENSKTLFYKDCSLGSVKI